MAQCLVKFRDKLKFSFPTSTLTGFCFCCVEMVEEPLC
jgi:hypothetical protein